MTPSQAGSRSPTRILVTGADGFVGRNLLPVLRAQFPHAVLIAGMRAGGDPAPPADESAAFDLLAPETMEAVIAAARPDALVHLAAQASVAAAFNDPLLSWRANLLGTVALGEAVLRQAPGCRFVFASSAEIYGLSFRVPEPLDEGAPLAPANPYAASKAACDLAIAELALRGLNAVRLRAFNHTGPGQGDAFVVSAFAKQVARIEAGLQEPLIRVGALDRWRDFLDVGDVCAAYGAALAWNEGTPAQASPVFNIASGVGRRVGDILSALLARSTVHPRIEADAGRLRPTDVERVVGDAGRARKVLGWAPAVAWDDTLDQVLADWRRRVNEAK